MRKVGALIALCFVGLAAFLIARSTSPSAHMAGVDPTTARRASSGSFFERRNDGAKTVIVFVHGVLGDGVGTWSKGGSYWPRMLADDHDFDGTDIYVFQYPTTMWGTLSIDELAENMRLYLDGQGVSDKDDVVFLAHSMGGLVVRAYLLKYRAAAAKTGFIYFFSTPSNGSEIASIASLLSRNPEFGKMPPMRSADYLADQQRAWLAADLGIPSYCAYEKRPTYGLNVVTQASATALCNKRLDPIDADHLDIVKPETTDDASYLAFKAAFKEQATAPRRSASRAGKSVIKVSIDGPSNDAAFPEGYPIGFVGRAFDPETGNLDDSDLAWTIDQGTAIGAGRSFTSRDLRVGRHRIVLTATSKEGRSATSSVDVDVRTPGTNLEQVGELTLPSRCDAISWRGDTLAVANKDDVDHSLETLSLFDIADASRPSPLASAPVFAPTRVVFNGSTLYVASASGSVRVFDTSGGALTEVAPPFKARPELGAILEAASTGSHLVLRGLTGGVEIVDVSRPDAPRHSSWWPGHAQGGAGFYKDELLVPERYAGFKVHGALSSPEPPAIGGLPGKTDRFSTNVEVAGDFAYVGSWAGEVDAIYLADPTKPVITGSVGGTGNAFRIALDGDKVFVAGLSEGLQVLDVSVPSTPRYDAAYGRLGSVADVVARPDLVAVCADKKVVLLRRSEKP